jgi:hypothetical protein
MTLLNSRGRALLGLFFLGLSSTAEAKASDGRFQLTSTKTNHVISSFAIAGGATGLMTSVFFTNDRYENDENLLMHVYRDDDWQKVQNAKSCKEKTQYARQTAQVKFELEDPEQAKKWGIKERRWRAETHLKIEPSEEDDYAPRHHYWYIVLDDCALEGDAYRDGTIPQIKYYLQIYNMLSEKSITHFSTDEFYLSRLHTVTMFSSAAVAFLLFVKICYHLQRQGIVHIAKFMVMWAAGFDTASSAFELMHMNFYRFDGVGFYLLDAFAAYNEAMCDAIVCMLLLAIAAGWTLPSDVISVQHGQDSKSILQTIISGLANPTGSKSWLNPFSTLFLGLIATHVTLAHWGLSYNDEYDSYHDLEHTPGKVLMGIRSILGFLFLAATFQTRIKCTASLSSFYSSFAVVGTIWFQGMPVMTWLCSNLVPYHLRHPYVLFGSAILQSTSLLLLSWVVAIPASSPYHKVSHMTQTRTDTLTEKIAGAGSSAATWSIFGKAKIRLD